MQKMADESRERAFIISFTKAFLNTVSRVFHLVNLSNNK